MGGGQGQRLPSQREESKLGVYADLKTYILIVL